MTTSHPLPPALDRTHSWARAQPWLRRFTLMNRLLLAMAFIPTGLVKATGQRFTLLSIDTSVGFFFEAMYRTGPYWHFIGAMQIAAALCLLIPATATLGALLFLPIIVSIVLVTWGIGFGGTVYITLAMLVAVIYLVCWDADRIWAAGVTVLGAPGESLLKGANTVERAGWLLGIVSGMGFFLGTRSFMPSATMWVLLVLGLGAILLVIVGWGMAIWKGPSQG